MQFLLKFGQYQQYKGEKRNIQVGIERQAKNEYNGKEMLEEVTNGGKMPMRAYSGFAEVYDLFMDNVPYQAWSRELIRVLRQYGISDGLVLDLGCGTGKMTRLLSEAGYDMIGLDSSEEMLGIAMEQGTKGSDILYLHQDMREFELYGTVRAVVSICDSMNYMIDEKELRSVFSLVDNYLDPGGIFIFDLNTLYKYREILGETTICENREEASFIWDNYYDETTRVNAYDLTLFVREEDGRYQKYEETHFQKGYEAETIRRLLKEANLSLAACFGEDLVHAPGEKEERIYFVARECTKNKGA